jgi:hypothetical protein
MVAYSSFSASTYGNIWKCLHGVRDRPFSLVTLLYRMWNSTRLYRFAAYDSDF